MTSSQDQAPTGVPVRRGHDEQPTTLEPDAVAEVRTMREEDNRLVKAKYARIAEYVASLPEQSEDEIAEQLLADLGLT